MSGDDPQEDDLRPETAAKMARRMSQSNLPVPDELAQVRERIKSLQTREGELRALLLANPDIREGASWLAEIRLTKQDRIDLKELRACHPDIVEQFTFPVEITSVVLSGITEDGELVSGRRMREIISPNRSDT